MKNGRFWGFFVVVVVVVFLPELLSWSQNLELGNMIAFSSLKQRKGVCYSDSFDFAVTLGS